jgi:HK97 family phage prohead protease
MSDDTTSTAVDEPADERPPRAPIEWRRAAGPMNVRFADRIIELVVVPYNFEGVAEFPPGSGRMVLETVDPGSFDGVERRANRVRVNRDHDVTRTVGRAFALHPSRSEGLVAETRISKTPLGDETLELADDGVIEASVGMAVMPSWHELLDNRTRRRIHKAFLDHIALAANPAYEGAVPILDVRTQPAQLGAAGETPNLDEVLAWMRARNS